MSGNQLTRLSFEGRTVIVTGAGRGLGRAYALELAARGAHVIVNDLGAGVDGSRRSCRPAHDVVGEIVRAGGRATASTSSVANEGGASRVVGLALEHTGRLDALVNNAGHIAMSPIEQATASGLMAHLRVHVLGTFLMCRSAWPHLALTGEGRIVNTVSSGIFGLRDAVEYAAAKGGVFALTRCLAVEAETVGIAVNAVAPQAATRMTDVAALEPEVRAAISGRRPAELVSPAVVYLAHSSCTLNGETLMASGGRVARIGLTENAGIESSNLTPEEMRDRLDDVMDPGSAVHWTTAEEKYRQQSRQ